MPETFRDKLNKIERIVTGVAAIDKRAGIPREEFVSRRKRVWEMIRRDADVDVALAFSDEHYSGDVPYLGGNTNYSIEQVAFGLGPSPSRSGIIAGFEGVYIAGQLAPRAGVPVYPTETLQLADEKYPVEGSSLPDILARIAGKPVTRIGLLSPRQVIPDGLVHHLEQMVGADHVVDVQEAFQRVKNLKSGTEMRLIADAAHVSAVALRGMLAVLEPGMEETEVAAFGDFVAKWMGCERQGFETMVGSDSACVTMIGPALNRPILAPATESGYLHLGTSYKRDGLTACCRRSVFLEPQRLTPYQAFIRELVEKAFRCGLDAYVGICRRSRPAREQEQALVDFFNDQTETLLSRVAEAFGAERAEEARSWLHQEMPGIPPGLARLKPYTGTHNAGYTECQEFYGAITLDSDEALEEQVVTMLDVALRGRGSRWLGDHFEEILPGFDYWVVEDTLGKFGAEVRNLTGELQPDGRIEAVPGRIPVNVQALVGNIDEFTR